MCARDLGRIGQQHHTVFPHVYLDATYRTVRNRPAKGGQVTPMARGRSDRIAADGSREILDVKVGDSEDQSFWDSIPLSLKQRSLAGMRLVSTISAPASWR